ncbi:DUF3592 domain-containing protein [Streptomyces sp. NPDC055506]
MSSPDLSKFLAGKKVPERSFVRTIHTVCARHRGTSVDDEERRLTDRLYMGALEHLNPPVWKLLSAVTERDAALARERDARRKLSQVRGRLHRVGDEAERLRRELHDARTARDELAARVERLLRQVRHLEGEAVVAEAIRIAEQAAAERPLSGTNVLLVRWSGIMLVLSTLVCVGALAAILIIARLADDQGPWTIGGWAAAGGAALVAAAAGRLRHEALRRLDAARDAGEFPFAAVLVVAAFATLFGSLSLGIGNQKEYLDHRSAVAAVVSDCERSPSSNDRSVPTYTCVHTWTVAGRTYQERASALASDEGKKTTVLIDPADPSSMLPERFGLRGYLWWYFIAVFLLVLPAGALHLLRKGWEKTSNEIRRAELRAKHVAERTPSALRSS